MEWIMGVTILFPLVAFRQFSLAAVLAAPSMGLLFSAIKSRHRKKAALVIMYSVAFISVIVSLYTYPPSFSKPDKYPESLIAFINKYDLKGRALHHPQDGGFLSYYFYPGIHIFADTRD